MFIFYAGHGVMSDDAAKNEWIFIVPYDVTQLYGAQDALAQKVFLQNSSKCFPKHTCPKAVVHSDACQSAGALEIVASRGAAEERRLHGWRAARGAIGLLLAGSDQFASEFGTLGHGVFIFMHCCRVCRERQIMETNALR